MQCQLAALVAAGATLVAAGATLVAVCGRELGRGLMSTQTDIIVLKITARMKIAR